MFTVQTVPNNEDERHPISVQFSSETPSGQEMTSHDLGNHDDLVQEEGHTLETIESQCPQSLSQSDVTAVQGSYVSLLADIATIEQNDEYANQQIVHDISNTVDYSTPSFTEQEHIQELASLQNENLVSFQSVDNHNIGYNLNNSVGNSQDVQQYVIIQPFLGDTSVNVSSTLIHLPNTTESLDSNKELEDAVANITETVVADTAEEQGKNVQADQSYIVSTNSRGEIKEIQVEQIWTANDKEVSTNKRKSQSKQKKGITSERKESSSHLKKFSLADLNSTGKSKKDVFKEYFERGKVRKEKQKKTKSGQRNSGISNKPDKANSSIISMDTGHGNSTQTLNTQLNKSSDLTEISALDKKLLSPDLEAVNEVCDKSNTEAESAGQQNIDSIQKFVQESTAEVEDKTESEREIISDYVIDPNEIIEDSFVKNKSRKIDKPLTTKGKTRILRSRLDKDKIVKPQTENKEKLSFELETALSGENENDKLKSLRYPLKRKTPMPYLKQSSKVPKVDNLYEKDAEVENTSIEDITESRTLEDFCTIFRGEEKCVLHLEPITLKLVNPNQHLIIEMDVEKDFTISPVEKGITVDGLTKYYVKFTVPEKFQDTNAKCGSAFKTQKPKFEKTNKKNKKLESKSLKKSKKKVNKTKNLVTIKETVIALRSKQGNQQEHNENTGSDLETLDNKIEAKVIDKDTAGMQRGEEFESEDIEIETQNDVDEFETNERTDAIKHNSIDGSNATKSKMKKKGGKSAKKMLKKDKSCSTGTKEDTSDKNYILVVSDEGKRMYRCDLCGKEMPMRQNMEYHINLHTGERPYQCEVCGLGFRGSSNLKAHMHQHEEMMRFSCNVCSRKFRDRGSFTQHVKRHLGEKEHVCEHCGKSFVITSDLKKHIRTHTGEKPFKCSVCDLQFSDGSSYVRHSKLHLAKFRYECNACQRQYSRKDMCKAHIKKNHKDQRDVVINEISIVEDDNQVQRDNNVRSKDERVDKPHKVAARKNSKRELAPNTKVKKLKKSWQTLTEEASKRYKEQTTDLNLQGTNQYREFSNQIGPTLSILDFQSVPTFYGNINQRIPNQQKPQLLGHNGQEIVTQRGPLVFQSYVRNITDTDI